MPTDPTATAAGRTSLDRVIAAEAAATAASRPLRMPLLLVTLALIAGCSITSRDAHDEDVTKRMRCVLAHDEAIKFDRAVDVRVICDRWEPVPTPEATP